MAQTALKWSPVPAPHRAGFAVGAAHGLPDCKITSQQERQEEQPRLLPLQGGGFGALLYLAQPENPPWSRAAAPCCSTSPGSLQRAPGLPVLHGGPTRVMWSCSSAVTSPMSLWVCGAWFWSQPPRPVQQDQKQQGDAAPARRCVPVQGEQGWSKPSKPAHGFTSPSSNLCCQNAAQPW